jgi:hypothetical protein
MSEPTIQAVQLDDGTIIYVEVRQPVTFADQPAPVKRSGELSRGDLGGEAKGLREFKEQLMGALPKPPSIEQTILSYTNVALNALKNVSSANVNKVTLEFGIKVGGKMGIPFVTEGTAESNLKVTVECSFPVKDPAKDPVKSQDKQES